MNHFTAHRLRIAAVTENTIELNEHQGSAIRGALFHALRNRFCADREGGECALCPLVTVCPVAFLVSTLNPQGSRGRDVPRPFTVQPPLRGGQPLERDGRLVFRYHRGERLEFGLTLYARALQLFPYIVLALTEWERAGLGRRVPQEDGQWRRGALAIRDVWAENPLSGQRQAILCTGEKMVRVPDLPITHNQVCHWAQELQGHTHLTLRFLTPARLIESGRLVKPETFRFQPFFQRLMERLEALSRHFSATPLAFDDPRGLIAAAAQVCVVDNGLTWEEVHSYSTRRRTESPISGLMGHVVLQADDWRPFLPWVRPRPPRWLYSRHRPPGRRLAPVPPLAWLGAAHPRGKGRSKGEWPLPGHGWLSRQTRHRAQSACPASGGANRPLTRNPPA